MKIEDFALWENRVAALSCVDGTCWTAHILTVDTKCKKLIVYVLGSNRAYRGTDFRSLAISPENVSSITPVAVCGDVDRYAPWADTCQVDRHFCPDHFVLFTICFVAMFVFASIAIRFSDLPGMAQVTAAIGYSAAVILYTFSSNNGGMQPFHFSCPFVRRQLPQLAFRHVWFVLGLGFFLTVGLLFAPYLPDSWLNAIGRGAPRPFWVLVIPSMVLAFTEVLLNRSLLKRAHPNISSLDEKKKTGSDSSRP